MKRGVLGGNSWGALGKRQGPWMEQDQLLALYITDAWKSCVLQKLKFSIGYFS